MKNIEDQLKRILNDHAAAEEQMIKEVDSLNRLVNSYIEDTNKRNVQFQIAISTYLEGLALRMQYGFDRTVEQIISDGMPSVVKDGVLTEEQRTNILKNMEDDLKNNKVD